MEDVEGVARGLGTSLFSSTSKPGTLNCAAMLGIHTYCSAVSAWGRFSCFFVALRPTS